MKNHDDIEFIANEVARVNRPWGATRDDYLKPLKQFKRNNWGLTPEELSDAAIKLTPGGTHNGGYLVNMVRGIMSAPCPRLVAACLYSAWQGGKLGFQFLPLPNSEIVELGDYRAAVACLIDELIEGDSHEILIGDDREFYDSLPDRFTAYRGCRLGKTSVEMASAGVCWTTSRAVARWFAAGHEGEPILLSTQVKKSDVHLAFATEFEVVIRPMKVRRLKAEPYDLWRSARPEMIWQPQQALL